MDFRQLVERVTLGLPRHLETSATLVADVASLRRDAQTNRALRRLMEDDFEDEEEAEATRCLQPCFDTNGGYACLGSLDAAPPPPPTDTFEPQNVHAAVPWPCIFENCYAKNCNSTQRANLLAFAEGSEEPVARELLKYQNAACPACRETCDGGCNSTHWTEITDKESCTAACTNTLFAECVDLVDAGGDPPEACGPCLPCFHERTAGFNSLCRKDCAHSPQNCLEFTYQIGSSRPYTDEELLQNGLLQEDENCAAACSAETIAEGRAFFCAEQSTADEPPTYDVDASTWGPTGNAATVSVTVSVDDTPPPSGCGELGVLLAQLDGSPCPTPAPTSPASTSTEATSTTVDDVSKDVDVVPTSTSTEDASEAQTATVDNGAVVDASTTSSSSTASTFDVDSLDDFLAVRDELLDGIDSAADVTVQASATVQCPLNDPLTQNEAHDRLCSDVSDVTQCTVLAPLPARRLTTWDDHRWRVQATFVDPNTTKAYLDATAFLAFPTLDNATFAVQGQSTTLVVDSSSDDLGVQVEHAAKLRRRERAVQDQLDELDRVQTLSRQQRDEADANLATALDAVSKRLGDYVWTTERESEQAKDTLNTLRQEVGTSSLSDEERKTWQSQTRTDILGLKDGLASAAEQLRNTETPAPNATQVLTERIDELRLELLNVTSTSNAHLEAKIRSVTSTSEDQAQTSAQQLSAAVTGVEEAAEDRDAAIEDTRRDLLRAVADVQREQTATLASAGTGPAAGDADDDNLGALVVGVVGGVLFLALAVGGVVWWRQQKPKRKKDAEVSSSVQSLRHPMLHRRTAQIV